MLEETEASAAALRRFADPHTGLGWIPENCTHHGPNHGADPEPDHGSETWDLNDPPPIRVQTQPAVRLGLSQVTGLSDAGIERILAERARQTFANVEDLARRAGLDRGDLSALAAANALAPLAGHRRNAAWQVAPLGPLPGLLAQTRFDEALHELEAPPEAQNLIADYASTGLTLGRHPIALLRGQLAPYQVRPAHQLWTEGRHGMTARASGLVTHRQRPETARGTVFVTLEDETGTINIIVPPKLLERDRRAVLQARLMTVYGVWERDPRSNGRVAHLVARRVVDHSALLNALGQSEAPTLSIGSRDFR
jgi:error-prone DNA polymerase